MVVEPGGYALPCDIEPVSAGDHTGIHLLPRHQGTRQWRYVQECQQLADLLVSALDEIFEQKHQDVFPVKERVVPGQLLIVQPPGDSVWESFEEIFEAAVKPSFPHLKLKLRVCALDWITEDHKQPYIGEKTMNARRAAWIVKVSRCDLTAPFVSTMCKERSVPNWSTLEVAVKKVHLLSTFSHADLWMPAQQLIDQGCSCPLRPQA